MKTVILFSCLLLQTLLAASQEIKDDFIYIKNVNTKFNYYKDSVIEGMDGNRKLFSFKRKIHDDVFTPILSDSLPDGLWIVYFENNQKALEVEIRDRQKHGEFKRYWNNGHLRMKVDYNSNKMDGEYVQFNSSGQISFQSYYFNNLEHLRITYYPNGQKEILQKYRDGKGTPSLLYWSENGEPLTSKQFMDYRKK